MIVPVSERYRRDFANSPSPARYDSRIATGRRRCADASDPAVRAKLWRTARLTPPPGAIAQLGERLDRTQEVASSSLASSIFREVLANLRVESSLCLADSSPTRARGCVWGASGSRNTCLSDSPGGVAQRTDREPAAERAPDRRSWQSIGAEAEEAPCIGLRPSAAVARPSARAVRRVRSCALIVAWCER